MTSTEISAVRPARTPRRSGPRSTLTRSSGLGLGIAMIWFSALVLIPLAAVVITAAGGGWEAFWDTVTGPQTSAAIKLTVFTALGVTAVNVVMGGAGA
jgi:sulfate transport system permease protein